MATLQPGQHVMVIATRKPVRVLVVVPETNEVAVTSSIAGGEVWWYSQDAVHDLDS